MLARTNDMAGTSRRMRSMDIPTPKKWRDTEASPDRIKVWRKEPVKEPEQPSPGTEAEQSRVGSTRAPVLYYLTLNGQLQHPHFVEVPLCSSQGLYLRDFIDRLDHLRGKGMASIYSWSSKRRYKSGFVWHDLTEDDLIHPSHGDEYVLKGSELLDPSPLPSLCSYPAFSNSGSIVTSPSPDHSNSKEIARRRNQSLSALDFNKYRVCRDERTGEWTPTRAAADASTQTSDCRRRRSHASAPVLEEDNEMQVQAEHVQEVLDRRQLQSSPELSKNGISPPPTDSSPESLDSVMKSHRRRMVWPRGDAAQGGTDWPSGRLRASSVLMQLISCGSIPFKDCEPPSSYSRGERVGASVIGGGAGRNHPARTSREIPNMVGAKLEEREYFSGSLVETGREVGPSFKRSASHSAWR